MEAPMKLVIMPGAPNASSNFHLIPSRNSRSCQIEPNTWMMPTRRSVSGSGKKKSRTGVIMVAMPNPVMAPIPLPRIESSAM